MGIFDDIARLFFPHRCPLCGKELHSPSVWLCNSCVIDMPLTGFWEQDQNPLEQKFWGLLPLNGACSLLHYRKLSPYTQLIYNFKYYNYWKTAYQMGSYFGYILKSAKKYSSVDYILPVPLHPLRRINRGYNQSEYIARGMAKALGCKLDLRAVKRVVRNSTQTMKNKYERWENAENIFSTRDLSHLKGKHILLVDDVITTGSTILSMAEQILKSQPDVTLSIACLATRVDIPGRGALDNE